MTTERERIMPVGGDQALRLPTAARTRLSSSIGSLTGMLSSVRHIIGCWQQ
jgi:hypothetical protein